MTSKLEHPDEPKSRAPFPTHVLTGQDSGQRTCTEPAHPSETVDLSRRDVAALLLGAFGTAALAGCGGEAEAISVLRQAETGASMQWADSVSELRDLDGSSQKVAILTGYHEAADGGGGVFRWVTPKEPNNAGTIIAHSTLYTGCWKRICTDQLSARWFGVIGDGTSDDTTTLQYAINQVPASGGTISIFSGMTVRLQSITIPANVTLRFENGGSIAVDLNHTVTVQGHLEAGPYHIFSGTGSVVFGTNSVAAVYPEWWGSDTAAVQAAIEKAPSGSEVLFTTEVYELTQTLTVTRSNVSFRSPNGSQMDAADIAFLIEVNNASNIKISGFHFCRVTTGSDKSERGILLTDASSCIKIFNNTFSNMYIGIVTALESDSNTDIEIHGNTFKKMGNLGIGVNNRGTVGVKIHHNYFEDCGYTQTGDYIGGGVEIRGNTGTIVTENHFYSFENNINPNDGVRVECISESPQFSGANNIVSNNVMDTIGGNGIRVIGNNHTLIANNQIINAHLIPGVESNGYHGNGILLTANDEHSQILSNHIEGCHHGITGTGEIKNTAVYGNTITNSDRAGIIIGEGERWHINGNNINGIVGNPDAGIVLQGCTDCLVENNNLANCGVNYGIVISPVIKPAPAPPIPATGNIVRNNCIRDAHDYGIYLGDDGNILLNNEVVHFNINRVNVAGTVTFSQIEASNKVPVPTSKTALCNPGDWATDSNYLYVAAPTDKWTFNWKRVALDDSAW